MFLEKHSSKIIACLMAAAVAVSLLAVFFSKQLTDIMGGMSVRMEYENSLFDTDEVIDIDIEMDEDSWNQMLANAISEEYYVCNVVINGRRVNNVAIRPKGNTSLSAIAMDPDTDRYSLKLEFDHFVDGQTCYGLDKLILNNNYADATNMKEAVIYDMYQYLGADASLYNYAKVSVNGEYTGVYLALEGIEDSFLLRNYGTQDGELYKPETMEIGGGQQDNDSRKGFSFSSGGANLNYTDDDLDSYYAIWDGEVTSTGKGDHRRVVTALKNIKEGTNLEEYLDVDNILKYMAVHAFAVNMDSLSGSMAHNYYLYEYDGKLNIFPWDYNLSFGGMAMWGSSDGTDMINDAIDTPFSSTDFFDALLENEEYCAQYHAYLKKLTDEYVNGGLFDESYNRIRSQIDSLVESDPTAFYTYDEYLNAADILYDVIYLRAQSIDGQIEGTIPSTDEGQKKDSSALIDGSSINVEAMGRFSMGAGGGNDRSNSGSDTEQGTGAPSQGNMNGMPGMPDMDFGNMPDFGDFDPGNMPDFGNFDPGNMPDFDMSNMPDFDFGDMPQMDGGNFPGGGNGFSGGDSDSEGGFPGGGKGFSGGNGDFSGGFPGGGMNFSGGDSDSVGGFPGGGMDFSGGDSDSAGGFPGGGGKSFAGGFPGGNMPSGMPGQGQSLNSSLIKNAVIIFSCLILMIVALAVVKGLKRKNK